MRKNEGIKVNMINNLWSKYEYPSNIGNMSGYLGVVYAIEYGDYIKIGCTSNIRNRYNQLRNQAEEYGNVTLGDCYITEQHERYKETEKRLHKLFADKRKSKTELFDISLNDLFDLTKDFKIYFSEINHDISDTFIDATKNFIKGITYDTPRYSDMIIFTSEEFGSIPVMIIDNDPWFPGECIAKILGYVDSSKALHDYVNNEDKMMEKMVLTIYPKYNEFSKSMIINEYGLYSLILNSPSSCTKTFKHWVTSKVLPDINKYCIFKSDPARYTIEDPDYAIRVFTMIKEKRNGVKYAS